MTDLDVCERQLVAAKESIANTKITNDNRDKTIARTKKEYDDAEANYEIKKVEYNTAKTNYDNFKNNDRSWRKQEGAAQCDVAWGWTNDKCFGDCKSNNQYYPNKDFQYAYTFEGSRRGCQEKCICIMPDTSGVRSRFDTMNQKKAAMDQAETEKNKKNNNWKDAIASPISSPVMNVACCSSSVTCGTDAACNNITQTCEATINNMKVEKTAAEKEAAEKKAAEKEAAEKEVEEKEAAEKEAAEKASAANQVAQTGQKSTNNIKPTNSSSNSSIISSIVLFCCSMLFIFIIIIVITMKKNKIT